MLIMTSIISRPQLPTSYVCFRDFSPPPALPPPPRPPPHTLTQFSRHLANIFKAPRISVPLASLGEDVTVVFSLGNIFQLPVTSLYLPNLLLGRVSPTAPRGRRQHCGLSKQVPCRASEASDAHRLSGKTKLALHERAAGLRRGVSHALLVCWLENYYSFLSTETVK